MYTHPFLPFKYGDMNPTLSWEVFQDVEFIDIFGEIKSGSKYEEICISRSYSIDNNFDLVIETVNETIAVKFKISTIEVSKTYRSLI